jgi:hypothetical protein
MTRDNDEVTAIMEEQAKEA